MKLYNYFRSSASYRVRIALALKGLDCDYVPVHLTKNEQFNESYAAVSASRLVPSLVDGDTSLTQSLAIIEYLDETHPEPPLLPSDAAGRARVRDLKVSENNKTRWYRHWVETGLETVERQLDDQRSGRFCHGDAPTLADLTLVPQIFNARRFDCRLDHVPQVMRVFDECMKLPAFEQTQPSKCPDAE